MRDAFEAEWRVGTAADEAGWVIGHGRLRVAKKVNECLFLDVTGHVGSLRLPWWGR
jgi:hypothetical protein